VSDQPNTTDHLRRDDKDFAVEFGGYLADTAERFLNTVNSPTGIADGRALASAIYEFRKRAAKAK
jgi:hypothetical protein